VNARYYTEMAAGSEGGAYQLPGSPGFEQTKGGEARAFPPGPGAIFYEWRPATPEGGDEEAPLAAIGYDIAPSEPVAIATGSSTPGHNVIELPYRFAVPAGGAAVLRMTYVQGYVPAEVRALANGALAGYPPSIAIGSPAASSVVRTASVQVTGTASDSGALASVSVNGRPATIKGASWSVSVPLSIGSNVLAATATDQAGLAAHAAESILYTPRPATVSRLGAAKAVRGGVTLRLTCRGAVGSCSVELTLTTVEHLRHGRLRALTARTRTVTVGRAKVTIALGKTRRVTVRLNSTGRHLLARFKRLPLKLSAFALRPAGGRSRVFSQRLTVKPVSRRRRG